MKGLIKNNKGGKKKMKEIELKIEEYIDNIEKIDYKSAIVNFDEGKVTIEKIKENIEDAGFTAEEI